MGIIYLLPCNMHFLRLIWFFFTTDVVLNLLMELKIINYKWFDDRLFFTLNNEFSDGKFRNTHWGNGYDNTKFILYFSHKASNIIKISFSSIMSDFL